jgi:Txe/YoeB family toxin of Txe-Axe toxin-antitoxin module
LGSISALIAAQSVRNLQGSYSRPADAEHRLIFRIRRT